MDIYRHKNHTVYKLKDRLLFFKNHQKMMFYHKGKLIKNHRFYISPNRQWKYFRWFIRQPFFYFERDNAGVNIGTPNKYFRIEKARRKSIA